jgi:hypothetical protein
MAVMASRRTAWLKVVLFTIVIYATLPVAPLLWRVFARRVGDAAEAIVLGGLLLSAIAIVVVAARNVGALSAARVASLVAIGSAYVVIIAMVELTPAEKLHFLYYGVLALLVYEALEIDLAGAGLVIATVGVVALIGFGDEVLQDIIPRRVFEWKDVALNAVSGGLATALILVFVGEDGDSLG